MQGSYCSQRVFCTGIITGEAETGYLIDVDDEESSPTRLIDKPHHKRKNLSVGDSVELYGQLIFLKGVRRRKLLPFQW